MDGACDGATDGHKCGLDGVSDDHAASPGDASSDCSETRSSMCRRELRSTGHECLPGVDLASRNLLSPSVVRSSRSHSRLRGGNFCGNVSVGGGVFRGNVSVGTAARLRRLASAGHRRDDAQARA